MGAEEPGTESRRRVALSDGDGPGDSIDDPVDKKGRGGIAQCLYINHISRHHASRGVGTHGIEFNARLEHNT